MLIDSHCHLLHSKYEKSLEEILSEADEDKVEKFICIGTSVKENAKVLDISRKYPQVFSTIGIYPHDERTLSIEEMRSSLTKLLKEDKEAFAKNRIKGIGECGIDISNWENERPLDDQIEIFEMQCSVALENDLPLVIHNRNGDAEILSSLKKFQNIRGVVHCFSSSLDVAKKFLDIGFYLSFSGMITYPSRRELMDIVSMVPDRMYLVETDAPYLPPQGHRGEVNYPKYVKIVAEKVAQVRNQAFEKVSSDTYGNTIALFNL